MQVIFEEEHMSVLKICLKDILHWLEPDQIDSYLLTALRMCCTM